MSWRQRAKCRGEGPELFFGTFEETPANRIKRERRAIAFCRGCDVRLECLDEGQNEEGIWGGLTEADRRRAAMRKPEARPIRIPIRNTTGDNTVDVTGWVQLEQDATAALYRKDSETSWHGSEFVVVKSGQVILVTVDLADAYMSYRRVIG